MALFLASHVHAVTIGEDLVFLDVNADAYFCLVGAAGVINLEPDGRLAPTDAGSGALLLEAGLAAEVSLGAYLGASPVARRRPPPQPTRDLPDTARQAGPRDILALGLACVATAAAFRFERFDRLVAKAAAQRDRARRAGPADEAVLEASAVFARLRPWSPVGGVCLKRSHLQLQDLRRLGLDADWVIGVRSWPFMAHCWLQSGPVALDDDVERLVAYTPIMVV